MRLGYLRGMPLVGDGGAGFHGATAALGYRSYAGAGPAYAGVDLGVVALHDGGGQLVLPNLSASLGSKLGPIDLGINVAIPLVAVSLTLGFELDDNGADAAGSARRPARPGVPRRRVQYRRSY